VADALYSGFVERRFARAEVLFARLSGSSESVVVRRPILPIDPALFRASRSGPSPLTNLPPRRLVEQLIGEHVFAELALAALESFASENAARLSTMESARLNIEEKLDELTAQERLLRQEQVTAEVQEITAGALAAAASG
jgi:F-type H+-transporting ATPase subunit gamma